MKPIENIETTCLVYFLLIECAILNSWWKLNVVHFCITLVNNKGEIK